MSNCEKCGAKLTEGDAFCSGCGTPVPASGSASTAPTAAPTPAASTPPPAQTPSPSYYSAPPQKVINLAGWGDRIIAFIIDSILVGIVFEAIQAIVVLPSVIWYDGGQMFRNMPFMSSGFRDLLIFAYFLFMDLQYGQSVGKMVMKLRVTNLDGGPIAISQAAIESFGKAFILPLDLLIGWIFLQEKSQRLFSFLAKTIVVKNER